MAGVACVLQRGTKTDRINFRTQYLFLTNQENILYQSQCLKLVSKIIYSFDPLLRLQLCEPEKERILCPALILGTRSFKDLVFLAA